MWTFCAGNFGADCLQLTAGGSVSFQTFSVTLWSEVDFKWDKLNVVRWRCTNLCCSYPGDYFVCEVKQSKKKKIYEKNKCHIKKVGQSFSVKTRCAMSLLIKDLRILKERVSLDHKQCQEVYSTYKIVFQTIKDVVLVIFDMIKLLV